MSIKLLKTNKTKWLFLLCDTRQKTNSFCFFVSFSYTLAFYYFT